MRTFIFLLLISSTHLFSQQLLTPQNAGINSKLIKDETSEAIWYADNAGSKIEIGSIITELKKLNKTDLLIRTTVKLKQAPDTKWIDSTLVKTSDFTPVYHSSYNMMRDMVLKSGKDKVSGYYLDKKSQKKDIIDLPAIHYFDSSSYAMLIRFLPLKENYTSEISIFDYNPKSEKKGIMKAYILDTQKTEYNGKPVWAVKTNDDISNRTSTVTYYIDPETRKIVKQDMDMAGRKMFLEMIQ
ncbi:MULTISPECIES: hypothetical protein [unclassified Chryseobacterium]|uniref:DUF3108 domain-containing protein n=1 Tax=unclassified Chryseobacterium TaxID=2593645 RepID=UPI00100A45FC|nr:MULTISPECIES: hypothetical protein [unclassified Chryseobacterium]RXM52587.1 hypothetical protein BOQ64_06915 [Chryseobacterium sp. CH25]RXM66643.1 hypothetical protein BOQ60_01385 [Chryseobacterium sp. CH1]